ncbi:hypothetical protein FE257_010962 [Aspergillus nanangensis]|uniref:Zn(2)-C6 fungal-type domain-containing protein n=1 Tax=Aspergillus nanangensis TaxID=2582783 RepID=A0AAD4GYD6_ASPNN|nr:hypothetical protein FE257_010962 [Aspergillus nanangensis]
MDDESSSPGAKRSKKACTECRQQKAKCDAYEREGKPCTRCAKMKAQCVISDPFRREHKRKRLSELEHEADTLRQRLRSSNSAHPEPSPIAMLTAAAEMGAQSTATQPGMNLTPQSQSPSSSYMHQPPPTICLGPALSRVDAGPRDRASDPTEPRVLNSIEVTREEIDDIFQIFFHQYSFFVPILDPQTCPNTYYRQSPVLFWAIIGIASRTYSKNPTLYTALSPSIMELAFLSVTTVSAPWHIIQGLVLILSWTFPKDNTKSEVTFLLSGLLLHLAMQNGLHIPMSTQEFTKKKIPAPSEADMIRRSELWAHCVLVYQRACMLKGQPPRSLADLEHDPGQRQMLFLKIAPSLALQVRCGELVARCCAAVLEIGVRTMSLEQERSLDILLRTYEGQVTDIEARASSADDRFHIVMCRLKIQAFHFYKIHTILSTNCLPRLIDTACATIESMQDICQRTAGAQTTPLLMYFAMLLSSVSLLRIFKGPASPGLDMDRARSGFFSAINLGKQMSVDSTDAPAKTVYVLNQIWNSTKAFRQVDGLEYTALRIRSRLILSPVIDSVWWWRDEFDPQCRATVPPARSSSEGPEGSRDNAASTALANNGLLERQDLYLFDDQFLADFEWALGDDGLLFPTEPYGSWPSMGAMM